MVAKSVAGDNRFFFMVRLRGGASLVAIVGLHWHQWFLRCNRENRQFSRHRWGGQRRAGFKDVVTMQVVAGVRNRSVDRCVGTLCRRGTIFLA